MRIKFPRPFLQRRDQYVSLDESAFVAEIKLLSGSQADPEAEIARRDASDVAADKN
jgi:hypothetical protein